MIKKLIAVVLLSAMLIGCKSESQYYNNQGGTNVIFSTNFNEEHYVWEGFLFPTNRTER